MTVKELKREQLQELKQKYYDEKLQEQENRSISYGEMANIDEIVTDDEIIKEFDGYMFTDDDFSPVEDEEDDEIIKKYKSIEKLRQQVKNNKKAMTYYEHLKSINKNDMLYGWMFDDDAILNDTFEDLDIYNENYLHDILICYYDELSYILEKEGR